MKRTESSTTENKEEELPNTIWRYDGHTFKAHCTDPGLAKKIASWRGCERSSVYSYPDGHMEMDVIFPERLYGRVAGLLELPLRRKNPKRIAQGHRMAHRRPLQARKHDPVTAATGRHCHGEPHCAGGFCAGALRTSPDDRDGT